jgi:hypothetical protein
MSAEHSARRNHHRQPRRPDANHWGKDGTRHDGIDPDQCPECSPKEQP